MQLIESHYCYTIIYLLSISLPYCFHAIIELEYTFEMVDPTL